MNIRFLGTSHGVPLPKRHCQSFLIETDGGDYLFDAGAPVMDILINENYDFKRLRAVFVTHMHSDHFTGLLDLTCLASWYYKDMNFQVFLPEQGGITAIKSYFAAIYSNLSKRIQLKLFSAGEVFSENGFTVLAYHTDHMDATSNIAYGFLVKTSKKSVYITGDMHRTLKDFNPLLATEKTDLVVAECAHFEPSALFEKLKDCKTAAVAAVHVFPVEKYEQLKALAPQLPFKMLFPNDGDVYKV